MQGLEMLEMFIFLNQLPEFFIPNTLHPFFTNLPLPGIRTFLASTANTSTNTITSTTRSIQDDSVLRRLLEYNSVSDESEADIPID